MSITLLALDIRSLQRKIDAAQRGLAIANTFRPSPYKAKHTSRIFGNLNRLRAQLRKLQKKFEAQADQHVALKAKVAGLL